MASTMSCDNHVAVLLNLISAHVFFFIPAVLLSPSLLLTAHLEEGDQTQIFPLQGKDVNTDNLSVVSLRDAQQARYIRLREISGGPTRGIRANAHDSGKQRDWLAVLLREHIGMRCLPRLVL